MGDLHITFLGTGTSVGVPMVSCTCAVCSSQDPRNMRTRSSIYCYTPGYKWVIDTGPDFRSQCLRERITEVDAVLYTHSHTDHVMGFDDLRGFCFEKKRAFPIYANPGCMEDLRRVYLWAFNGENRYPGYIHPDPHVVTEGFFLEKTKVMPLFVEHGKVETNGYLFTRDGCRSLAYIPDCKRLRPESEALLRDVDVLIIDGLRYKEHPTHMNIPQAIECAERVGAKETWLTHLTHDIDHEQTDRDLPDGVKLAFDGLKISL